MSEPRPEPDPDMADIRPHVARAPGNRGVILFGLALALGAGSLFAALESRRAGVRNPSVAAVADEGTDLIAPPADLTVPPAYGVEEPAGTMANPAAAQPVRFAALAPRPPALARSASPTRYAEAAPALPSPSGYGYQLPSGSPLAASARSGPEVVYDVSTARPRPEPAASSGTANTGAVKGDERVKAARFENPASTVPKGTVIQAVLETALDSTRAGFARAIISRDVYGFDGTKVVIPRGSRLIGEYKADLQAGQSRALIQWQRLMRPDGVMVSLDSPSADPLGRAGVKGAVDNHFLEKFGSAILQSAISIGTQVAVNRLANGTVVYAVPVLSQALPVTQPDKIQPTLKVRQGTSVSVFVARDLDFTGFER